MTKEADLEQFHDIFVNACKSLFYEDCRIDVITEGQHFNYKTAPAACIDGGNEQFDVIMTLHMPHSALVMTYPISELEAVNEEQLEDWISELSNRLLGKFNQELEVYGQHIKCGLPQSEYGQKFIQTLTKPSTTFIHCFDVDGEVIQVSFQAELHSDFVPLVANRVTQIAPKNGFIEFL